MTGKNKCKILKDIRRQIAAQNDIEYITSECKYQGECAGTCPKCEAEVRYLEEQLRRRQQAGKAVALAGIAAAMVVTASGCDLPETGGAPNPPYTTEQTDGPIPGALVLPTPPLVWGDIAEITPPETTEATEPIDDRLPPYNDDTLMGYVGD